MWFPNGSKGNNAPAPAPLRLPTRHWLRVVLTVAAIGGLTWYANRSPVPKPVLSRSLGGWIQVRADKVEVLLVFPDGSRLWSNPDPRDPLSLQRAGARYRGPRIFLVADSLPLSVLDSVASTLDSGGTLLVRGLGYPPEFTAAPLFRAGRNLAWSNPAIAEVPNPLSVESQGHIIVIGDQDTTGASLAVASGVPARIHLRGQPDQLLQPGQRLVFHSEGPSKQLLVQVE